MKVFLQANGVLSDKKAPRKKGLHERVTERRRAHPIRYITLPGKVEYIETPIDIDINLLASKIADKLSIMGTQPREYITEKELKKTPQKFIPIEDKRMEIEMPEGETKKSFTKLGKEVKTSVKPTDLSSLFDQ